MKIFNVEFDGIDKTGKDYIANQMKSVSPNIYCVKSRGLMSQIAYGKLYNRNIEYEVTNGYIENTLFILLTVDEDDWNVRCDLSGEHEKNKYRTDLEDEVKYESNSKVFVDTYNDLKSKYSPSHFMRFNTSEITPIKIIKEVVKRLEKLNEEEKNLEDSINDNRKYVFTDQFQNIGTNTLYRIKAVKDFGDVKKGDLGGWIERELNLSHNGNCWVYDQSKIYGKAAVVHDAKVFNNSSVYFNATIANCGLVNNSIVGGKCIVMDKAEVRGVKIDGTQIAKNKELWYTSVDGNIEVR